MNCGLTDIDDLLPYQFDISIFHTLANPDLIDHIQRVGITIYQKKGGDSAHIWHTFTKAVNKGCGFCTVLCSSG